MRAGAGLRALAQWGAALAMALLLGGAGISPAQAQAGGAGYTMQVINFPSDPPGAQRQAPGGGRVLTPGVLYTPAAGGNPQSTAIVMLDQGPGAHPLERGQVTRDGAERLAAMGYTVLSLYAGQERGFARVPFDEVKLSVRGALDWLEVLGHDHFVLVAQGYGAIVAAHYLATERDTLMDHGGEQRVKAVVYVNPLTELRRYPRADLQERYDERVAQARASVAAGRGGIPQLEPGRNVAASYDPWLLAGPFIAPAVNWLDYWGPEAAERNARLLARPLRPTLVLAGEAEPTVSIAALRGLQVDLRTFPGAGLAGRADELAAGIAGWLSARGLGVMQRVATRVLDVETTGGRVLQGVLYEPERPEPGRPALMLVGGRTADTVQSSTHWMGVRLAAQGLTVIAPGLRVSGVAGFQASTHAEAAEDIGRWIDRAAALGHRRVVLTGHSNGGIWISNYLSLTQDPRVAGMVYFAPTRDTVSFAQAEEGAQYARNLEAARAALARGDGLRQVIGLYTAQAWLDNNGPDSRGWHTRRISEFERPGLAIAGNKDPLMTPAFLQEFRAAYKGPLTLLEYPDGSHGLRENKGRLGLDVAAWVKRMFP